MLHERYIFSTAKNVHISSHKAFFNTRHTFYCLKRKSVCKRSYRLNVLINALCEVLIFYNDLFVKILVLIGYCMIFFLIFDDVMQYWIYARLIVELSAKICHKTIRCKIEWLNKKNSIFTQFSLNYRSIIIYYSISF